METILKIIYWLGITAEIAVRAPIQMARRRAGSASVAQSRVSVTEQMLFGLLSFGGFVVPLIYTVTPWLNFAEYHLPVWLGWLGVVIYACGLFVFWRAHHDLRFNWSPSLEIYQKHTLITNGIYRLIRHPMYASQWLFSIAQALLLQNWLAGPISFVLFIPFYLLRTRAEEKMMLDTFGDEYRAYHERTGGVIPKI